MLTKAFDLQRLRVLVEVARQGSVSRAAEALMLSQPTVSLHLKALASMLGVPVVQRQGRGIELTEAGRVLERHAVRALAELEQAREAIERHRGLETGSLHIGAGTTPGTYVLPRLLGEFHARHPGIELRLEVGATEQMLELLHRGELHLAVVGEAAAHSGIEQRPLMRDRLLCIASPQSEPGPRAWLSRADFRAATLLARKAGSSTQAVADAHLARHRLEPRERWELDSPEAIKQAVRAGLGVAFLSELVVADELAAGQVAAVEIEGVPTPERTLDLARAAHHPLSPPERAFLELMEERAGDRRAVSPSRRPPRALAPGSGKSASGPRARRARSTRAPDAR